MSSDKKCDIDGCYRPAKTKLFVDHGDLGTEGERRLVCDPCHSAIRYGTDIPPEALEVIESR